MNAFEITAAQTDAESQTEQQVEPMAIDELELVAGGFAISALW